MSIINTCVGVDPGIANTGIACIYRDVNHKYHILKSVRVRTKASEPRGARLSKINDAFVRMLEGFQVNCIAIERVYHNRNISSSLSTAAVMGVLELTAYAYGLPVFAFTPQEVKAGAGVPGAGKDMMLKMASRLFRTEKLSHHEADAAFVGLVGLQAHHREKISDGNGNLSFAKAKR